MEIHGYTDDHVVKTFHTESTTSEREAVTVVFCYHWELDE